MGLPKTRMIEEYDALIIRCPQLGGEVPFTIAGLSMMTFHAGE